MHTNGFLFIYFLLEEVYMVVPPFLSPGLGEDLSHISRLDVFSSPWASDHSGWGIITCLSQKHDPQPPEQELPGSWGQGAHGKGICIICEVRRDVPGSFQSDKGAIVVQRPLLKIQNTETLQNENQVVILRNGLHPSTFNQSKKLKKHTESDD